MDDQIPFQQNSAGLTASIDCQSCLVIRHDHARLVADWPALRSQAEARGLAAPRKLFEVH